MADPVLVSDRTPWGVRLTLNRPDKLNALSGELVEALSRALDAAGTDANVRVIAQITGNVQHRHREQRNKHRKPAHKPFDNRPR